MKKKEAKNVITGFTHYTTKPGTGETFLFHCQAFMKQTRTESGCIHFELFQSHTCSTCFIIYHKWESAKVWEEHLNMKYTAEFINAINHIVDKVELIEASETPDTFV
ncbi:Antibiotic biosynthesis monooxygenase [Poriferisphaera corsica]|uniref:Antibiotic biosynthesis monooxygenase n=1 Tax=Poriferisphaera corsica TaxID=2528020 RepID=A0A517YYT4_9BACT|nr:antibiotic biosynthesis monooxygenase [Poriferisphaera corsica]QDU35375.1 Antibiotic biosynthesis monooxygenase [Poriferisphaera corsica]